MQTDSLHPSKEAQRRKYYGAIPFKNIIEDNWSHILLCNIHTSFLFFLLEPSVSVFHVAMDFCFYLFPPSHFSPVVI